DRSHALSCSEPCPMFGSSPESSAGPRWKRHHPSRRATKPATAPSHHDSHVADLLPSRPRSMAEHEERQPYQEAHERKAKNDQRERGDHGNDGNDRSGQDEDSEPQQGEEAHTTHHRSGRMFSLHVDPPSRQTYERLSPLVREPLPLSVFAGGKRILP